MNKTFNCPNCGAPIDYLESGELTVRCPFCNNSVIVPEELRPAAPAETPPAEATPETPAQPVNPVVARLDELASTETNPRALRRISRIERRILKRQERDEQRRLRRQR
jgi:uncharacterized Zn finger protein (UPF0148 family)